MRSAACEAPRRPRADATLFANLGRSPAFITELWAQLFILPNPILREIRDLHFADSSLHKMGDVIPGGEKIENVACYLPPDATERIEEIKNRSTYLILKVMVFYTDVFEQKHHTNTHWLYHTDKDYFASYTTKGANSFD
jgi:hypothetical protein